VCVCVCVYVYVCVCTCMCTICVCKHTCIHTYTHTYICMHTHTHTHTHAHMHICMYVHVQGPRIPDTISANAKNFLEACLQSDYAKRPSAHKLLSHALVEHVKYLSMTQSADLLSGYRHTYIHTDIHTYIHEPTCSAGTREGEIERERCISRLAQRVPTPSTLNPKP